MFRRITAQNFLSWENLAFDVEEGTTLISGFNHDDDTPEGSGKSAVVNALSWGLFGKVPKSVNINDVIREGEKGCKVEILMDGGHTLVRSRNPNHLYITDEGGNQIKGIDAKQTQSMIEKYIGMSFNTFCQTIYFPQNAPKKFILGTDEDKSKILAELQDTLIFDRARKDVLGQLREAEKSVLIQQKDLEALIQKSELQKAQIANLEEIKSHYQQDKEKKLNALNEELKELAVTTDNVEKQMHEYDETEEATKYTKDRLEELRGERRQLEESVRQEKEKEKQRTITEVSLSNLFDKLTELQQVSVCPTCGQDETEQSKAYKEQCKNELHQDIAKLEAKYNYLAPDVEVATKVHNLDCIIEEITRQLQGFEKEGLELQRLKYQHESLMKQGSDVVKQIKAIENESTEEFDKNIANLQMEINDTLPKIEKAQQTLLAHKMKADRLGFLKDGFKEVKQYVFQQLLVELNERTNQYLAELFDVPVRIEFTNKGEGGDVGKIQTSVNFDGVERSIGLLSGGQQKRVEIATDLALSDVTLKRSSRNIKLRIFDEAFQNLSEASMQKVIQLFQRLGGSVIIIEHNSIIKNIIDKTFQIELREGVSKRVA